MDVTLFFINLLFSVLLIFLCHKNLISDYKKLDYKKLLKHIIFFIILVFLLNFVSEKIYNIINIDTTENQSSLEKIIKEGNIILNIFSFIIFAPIYEELVFRKLLSNYIKDDKKFLLCSTLLFSIMHISSNILECFVYIPYAYVLGLIYIKNDKNIYFTILFHSINNLIAFLLIVL